MSDVGKGEGAFKTVYLDTVDSTNAEALRRAVSGGSGPMWIRAGEQTSGRGRQGRPWISRPGNLYCSLLLGSQPDPHKANGLSFVAALGVYDAVATLLADAKSSSSLLLKWPNDVLLDGAKLSGILLEGMSTGNGVAGAMAIGIGINVTHHPDTPDYRTACLAGAGVPGDVDAVFNALAGAVTGWLDVWRSQDGFSLVRDAWIARAGGIGEAVRVRLPEGELYGTFVGLDEDGALILRNASGQDRRILAGDLFLSASATTAMDPKGPTPSTGEQGSAR